MGNLAFVYLEARGPLRLDIEPIKKVVRMEARKPLKVELSVRRSG